jgi:hypothetical protein
MEEDIRILEEYLKGYYCSDFIGSYGLPMKETEALENLLQAYKQDEKVIEEMAKAWKQDDIRSVEEIIDYFRKRCE